MNRYIPFTQQPYCCVTASLQIVMYRHSIPLIAQEDLAYALGLTVPKEDVHLFKKVRTGKRPSSGWGTQIQNPKYEINSILQKLHIPLAVELHLKINSATELKKLLQEIQAVDGDALLCFDYGVLWDRDFRGGHVCVFDYLEGNTVHIVDPESKVPKHREHTVEKFFEAMKFHGPKNMCGVWIVRLI